MTKICTADERPTEYVNKFTEVMAQKLGKEVVKVPILTNRPIEYSAKSAAEAGKLAGVDYVFFGDLYQYTCASTSAKVGSAIVAGVTTALSPVTISGSPWNVVASTVNIVRTSDGKLMGSSIRFPKIGQGWLGSCERLTGQIAGDVYDLQFVLEKREGATMTPQDIANYSKDPAYR